MIRRLHIIIALCIAIFAIRYKMTAPIAKDSVVNLEWNFTAQRGYFSHDEDPESWDFRAVSSSRFSHLTRLMLNRISLDH
jgi:hypothetical protein